ncbi:MAG: twin-arginine translocation signal domain-containing protein [Betaproteobacteria bacterium]|nr:twin-arginine translocation signal domain-containing protein [Betaproteobacteria bacterium]
MLDLTVSRRDLLKQVGLGAISAGDHRQ